MNYRHFIARLMHRTARLCNVAGLAAALWLGAASTALAAGGDFDTTFSPSGNPAGIARFIAGGSESRSEALLVTETNAVFVAGYCLNSVIELCISKRNAGGGADSSFGGSGTVTISGFGSSAEGDLDGARIQCRVLDVTSRIHAEEALHGTGISVPEFASYAPVLWRYWAEHLDPDRARRGAAHPLAGRHVIITGASSGIGQALALRYHRAGWRLALVARRSAEIERWAVEQGLDRGSFAVYAADVRDIASIVAAGRACLERQGLPDVVIANAGVSVGTLTEMADDLNAFERVLRTNVLGMVATFQPFVAPLRARGQGRLVGIASVAGIRGLPGAGAYSASKAAVIAYLESLRVELHGTGVKVVTIAPGYIETPMTSVNTYPMPFLLPADQAAVRFARAIEAGVSYTVIPWQMGVVGKLLRLLPNPLFDRLFARAGRKPRGLPL